MLKNLSGGGRASAFVHNSLRKFTPEGIKTDAPVDAKLLEKVKISGLSTVLIGLFGGGITSAFVHDSLRKFTSVGHQNRRAGGRKVAQKGEKISGLSTVLIGLFGGGITSASVHNSLRKFTPEGIKTDALVDVKLLEKVKKYQV